MLLLHLLNAVCKRLYVTLFKKKSKLFFYNYQFGKQNFKMVHKFPPTCEHVPQHNLQSCEYDGFYPHE